MLLSEAAVNLVQTQALVKGMTACTKVVVATVQLKDMVRQQAAHDVDPPLSEAASYIKNEMSKEGYRHLLAVGMFLHPHAAGGWPGQLLHMSVPCEQLHCSHATKQFWAQVFRTYCPPCYVTSSIVCCVACCLSG